MGKTYHNLFPQIVHPLNLWQAYKNAARGKRAKPAVAAFEYELEQQLIELETELREGTYHPAPYHSYYISSPKKRLISAALFRDRVVHHALMNVIGQLFERQFIYDSYANRVGKGTHRALDRCTYYLQRHRYVMHCDVRQFFPAIDHTILLSILSRTIGDMDVMKLIAKILASGASVLSKEYDMLFFPGDDLFAIQRARGLPIGNLTSQHWANVYLNELDQYAKRVLKIKAYIRYVDDILVFADAKHTLHHWRDAIAEFLQSLRLTLHPNRAQPRPVETGVPFLGFHVYPTHRRLKRRNGIKFQRRLKSLVNKFHQGEITQDQLQASLLGWLNHVRYGDTWGLRREVLASAGLGLE